MNERADIERAILDEEAMLGQVARLLERGADLAGWPEAERTALALALEDPSMSLGETWKAVALRRHLFGPTAAVPAHLAASRKQSPLDQRRAERLRAGLPALVRYRAGSYLLRAVRAD